MVDPGQRLRRFWDDTQLRKFAQNGILVKLWII